MAGLITNPLTWAKGKLATAEWFQQIQDNVNSLYGGGGSNPRYYWIHSSAWIPLTLADWSYTNSGLSRQAAGTTALVAPIPNWGSADSAFNVISEIKLTVTTAGATPLTLYLMRTIITTTVSSTTTSVLSVATSTSPSTQQISLSTAINVNSTDMYALRIVPGQVGDVVYGARLKVG
jgi:hypothetical protein